MMITDNHRIERQRCRGGKTSPGSRHVYQGSIIIPGTLVDMDAPAPLLVIRQVVYQPTRPHPFQPWNTSGLWSYPEKWRLPRKAKQSLTWESWIVAEDASGKTLFTIGLDDWPTLGRAKQTVTSMVRDHLTDKGLPGLAFGVFLAAYAGRQTMQANPAARVFKEISAIALGLNRTRRQIEDFGDLLGQCSDEDEPMPHAYEGFLQELRSRVHVRPVEVIEG